MSWSDRLNESKKIVQETTSNPNQPRQEEEPHGLSRRSFFQAGGLSIAGMAGLIGLREVTSSDLAAAQSAEEDTHVGHGGLGTVGNVDHDANEFNPHEILTDFDYGEAAVQHQPPPYELVILWDSVPDQLCAA